MNIIAYHKVIDVEISPSEMEAYVTVNPEVDALGEDGHRPISFMSILAALKQAGVTVGIDEAKIHELLGEKQWRKKVLVAKGRPPLKGENGAVTYCFEVDKKPRPKEDAEGRVDFREIGLVNLVEEDDVLARRIPAKIGKAGATVNGRVLEPSRGEDVFINAGLNTYFKGDDGLELRASKTGSVSLVSGAVQVEDTLTLRNGVNFTSGNVNFPGDVVVIGDVESGFAVKCGGKIEISGVVEDADIEAAGEVLVKGGFIGSGKGRIRADKDVYIKFVVNQVIEAGETVYVGTNCVQAKIIAKQVQLTMGAGTVVGGNIQAKEEIRAKVLGNPQHTLTVIEILSDGEDHEHALELKQAEIKECKNQIMGIKSSIAQLQTEKVANKKVNPAIVEKIRKDQEELKNINEKYETLNREYDEFQLHGGCLGSVHALTKVYPGAQIIMGNASLIIQKESGKAIFERCYNEIVDVTSEQFKKEARALAE